MSLRWDIAVESQLWERLPTLESVVEQTLGAALIHVPDADCENTEISFVFSDDAGVQELNRTWRSIDKPTNVLSFPQDFEGSLFSEAAPAARPLGDIVMAAETVFREAETSGLATRSHVAHLIVHGFLHLLGYDHEDEDNAGVMEALETRILADLGIADPYDTAYVKELFAQDEKATG